MEHLDSALENFCLSHWPCEFVAPQGGRCINVRSGHAKGHQVTGGAVLAASGYTASFSAEAHRAQWQTDVYDKMVALWQRTRGEVDDGKSEQRAMAQLHREKVLPKFIKHASHGDPRAFMSHTVCMCCLFEPPEHALRCGHIICTECLKIYGRTSSNGLCVDIMDCPLELMESRTQQPWRVLLKPSSCGIRMLSLDG